jgi:hypothetical protein
MVRSHENAKEGFEYKTIQGCRTMISKFIKNRLIREKLIRYIREESITGYQLNDILTDNLVYDKIRDKIIRRMLVNKEREKKFKDPRVIAAETDTKFMKEETKEEKEERYGLPNYDIKKLLEEFKVEEPEKKLEEHKIDKEVFWKMELGDFEKPFELKKWGTRRQLRDRMDEIMEEH